jgi:hypothetical protein
MTGAAASAFLGTIGAVPLRVRGPVLVASGSAAGQAATVAVRELQAEGPVAVRGGAGNDLLRIDNCAFLGSFTVDLGGGADRLELEQEAPCGAGVPSGFAGPVLVRGGSGADAFVLGGDVSDRAVAFRNAVAVDGGAGSDTVAVGSLVTFDPAHPLAQINIA